MKQTRKGEKEKATDTRKGINGLSKEENEVGER
jgi:hypothetical protein